MADVISTIQELWNQARSAMGMRDETPEWIVEPDEILEWVYNCEFEMALKVPEKFAGKLRDMYTADLNFGTTKYADVKYCDLPDTILRILAFHVQLPGVGYKPCDMRNSAALDMIASANYYDTPDANYPWAMVIGREVWVAPVDSATFVISVLIDAIVRPSAKTNYNSVLQIDQALRPAMVHYLAARCWNKRGLADKFAEQWGLFTQSWQDVTGAPWGDEIRDHHKPPKDEQVQE